MDGDAARRAGCRSGYQKPLQVPRDVGQPTESEVWTVTQRMLFGLAAFILVIVFTPAAHADEGEEPDEGDLLHQCSPSVNEGSVERDWEEPADNPPAEVDEDEDALMGVALAFYVPTTLTPGEATEFVASIHCAIEVLGAWAQDSEERTVECTMGIPGVLVEVTVCVAGAGGASIDDLIRLLPELPVHVDMVIEYRLFQFP